MKRTQISFDEWQYETLRADAERRGVSMASLVREAVTGYLNARKTTSLEGIVGIGSAGDAHGRDHDHLLYGGHDKLS